LIDLFPCALCCVLGETGVAVGIRPLAAVRIGDVADGEGLLGRAELRNALQQKFGLGLAEPAAVLLTGRAAQPVGIHRDAFGDEGAVAVARPLAIAGAIQLDGETKKSYLVRAHRLFAHRKCRTPPLVRAAFRVYGDASGAGGFWARTRSNSISAAFT